MVCSLVVQKNLTKDVPVVGKQKLSSNFAGDSKMTIHDTFERTIELEELICLKLKLVLKLAIFASV